jgi:hypothetical protein
MTVLLIGAICGFAWVIIRVVGGLGAGAESSARADTFVGGAGIAADHLDTLRSEEQRGNRDT